MFALPQMLINFQNKVCGLQFVYNINCWEFVNNFGKGVQTCKIFIHNLKFQNCWQISRNNSDIKKCSCWLIMTEIASKKSLALPAYPNPHLWTWCASWHAWNNTNFVSMWACMAGLHAKVEWIRTPNAPCVTFG